MEAMLSRFKKLLSEVTGIDAAALQVAPESKLVQDFNLDSISIVSLLFLCETEFNVGLTGFGEELMKITTTQELLDFIVSKGGR